MGITKKGARIKGKRLEWLVAKRLCDIGLDAKRVPLSGALAWLKGDVAEFHLGSKHVHECKNHESLAIQEWWRQAAAQAINDGETPVLHFSSNYKGVFSVLQAQAFDDMVYKYEEHKPEIALNVTDFPQRKNFWKYAANNVPLMDIYLYQVDDEDLVICNLELYLKLRKVSVQHLVNNASTSAESQVVHEPLPQVV